jgi:hypothetical protein
LARRGGTVVIVRHDSTEPGSSLRPSLPGNAFQPVIEGEPDLLVEFAQVLSTDELSDGS